MPPGGKVCQRISALRYVVIDSVVWTSRQCDCGIQYHALSALALELL